MPGATVDPSTFLARVLDRARARTAGEHALVVLDLDSTLYDTRPRSRAILREWAAAHRDGHPVAAERILAMSPAAQVYGLEPTLRNAGVDDEAVHDEVVAFWQDRFFTDAYCRHNVPFAGALEYARALHDQGLFLVYLTGRDAPGMLVGTTECLRRDGFPIGVAGSLLLMKPDFRTRDVAFKASVLDHVAAIGEPVAAFDNEPENCNLFAERWPGCLVAFLDTGHSAGAPPLHPDVAILRDFVG